MALAILHEWLSEEGLSDYTVEINDKFVRPQE
jgi:hypothetical protein